jgi:hypothetical protein
MRPDVVNSLAAFLEAMPYQVETWDRKVVERLSADQEKLNAFDAGTADTKWWIYSSIKYSGNSAMQR